MDPKIKIIFIGIILYCLIIPTFAYAYIDPGTGSYIVQVVIGILLGAILSIRILWIHISLIPESNATVLARSVKNVKLDSYDKLQKIK